MEGVATGVEDLGDLVQVGAGTHQLDAGGFQAIEGIVLVAMGAAVQFGVDGLGDEAGLGDALGVSGLLDVGGFDGAGAEGLALGPLLGLAGAAPALLGPLLVAALGDGLLVLRPLGGASSATPGAEASALDRPLDGPVLQLAPPGAGVVFDVSRWMWCSWCRSCMWCVSVRCGGCGSACAERAGDG